MLCLCVGEMPVSEMLFAYWSVGSRVVRSTRENLTICQYAMMSRGVSGVVVAAKLTRAEAEASDGSDIGSVKKVRVNYARGGSTPPALTNH